MHKLISTLCCICIYSYVFAQSLEQTAGIYYAYPGPQTAFVDAPDGYTPFYISHYGRHGSRWITEDKRYTDVYDLFADTAALTPLGRDVKARLEVVLDDALGRSGSLSPLGERQHHDIAARMYGRFPQVFADSAIISAASSTSLRCAMSMSFFTESLKELNPSLRVGRTAYDCNMDYIAYTSPEGKEFSADTAAWRADYWSYVSDMVSPERLVRSLFVNPDDMSVKDQFNLMTGLYWIASDMQDVDPEIDFYDVFSYDELHNCWSCINARMYICNADAPQAEGVMMHCADNLLNDIISKADMAVANGDVAANLRFGHDTHLLRLLALMGVEGARAREGDIKKICEVWQDYSLTPMAANIQLVLYRNQQGNVIATILLNEDQVCVDIPYDVAPGFYDWQLLRDYLMGRLTK